MQKDFPIWVQFEDCKLADLKEYEEVFYTIKRETKEGDDLHGPFTVLVQKAPHKVMLRNQNGVELPAFSDDRVRYWRLIK